MTTLPLLRLFPALVLVLLFAGSSRLGAAPLDIDAHMDEATARAMLARLGYGATPASLAAGTQSTPREYVLRAISGTSGLPPVIAAQIQSLPSSLPLEETWKRLGPGASRPGLKNRDFRKSIRLELEQHATSAVMGRLLMMANSDNPGHEALLSFWLNHFSVYAPKSDVRLLASDYVRALDEAMKADSFEALLRASFLHPAMQVYLDNDNSTAPDSPVGLAEKAKKNSRGAGINENLARELLELHTLGVDGGYTQEDVQNLARIITGAGTYALNGPDAVAGNPGAVRIGLFLFNPRRHDFSAKTLLGTSFPAGEGFPEIERTLHLLATHPKTAHFISLKLARRFLGDNPPPRLVDAMASQFLRSGGKISETLLPLLSSEEFAASLRAPARFKEPLDYVLSVARAACADAPVGNDLFLLATAVDMGEAPLMRSTPDGYSPLESAWLSPAAMAKRTRLAINVAAGRAPLAQGHATRLPALKAVSSGRATGAKGRACNAEPGTVLRVTGPLSGTTQAAATRLSGKDNMALLLASPEFMSR